VFADGTPHSLRSGAKRLSVTPDNVGYRLHGER
jgi:hypothetical protein